MRTFIKTPDDEAWSIIESGQKKPTKANGEKKIRSNWTLEEMKESPVNAKPLSTIFAGDDQKQFKLISQCETAKEAWDTLQKIYSLFYVLLIHQKIC